MNSKLTEATSNAKITRARDNVQLIVVEISYNNDVGIVGLKDNENHSPLGACEINNEREENLYNIRTFLGLHINAFIMASDRD